MGPHATALLPYVLVLILVFALLWDLIRGFLHIVLLIVLISLLLGYANQPKETGEVVVTAGHTAGDIAHKIGDALKSL